MVPDPELYQSSSSDRMIDCGNNAGHDSVVLSAFGCGVFGNPPKHIAQLFAEVLRKDFGMVSLLSWINVLGISGLFLCSPFHSSTAQINSWLFQGCRLRYYRRAIPMVRMVS